MRISNDTLYISAVSGEWIEQLHLRLNICVSSLDKTPSVKSLIVQDQILNVCCLKGLCWYVNIILILSHAMHRFSLHEQAQYWEGRAFKQDSAWLRSEIWVIVSDNWENFQIRVMHDSLAMPVQERGFVYHCEDCAHNWFSEGYPKSNMLWSLSNQISFVCIFVFLAVIKSSEKKISILNGTVQDVQN